MMERMKRRLFIALPLQENVEAALMQEAKTLAPRMRTFARFLAEDTWHLTLTFLGDQEESQIPTMERAMREAMGARPSPKVTFERIAYGPPQGSPRMIWLLTDHTTSIALGRLRNSLENNLETLGIRWERDHRPYHGHLTLARFRPDAQGPFPPLDRPFQQDFAPTSLNLMESELQREGALYTVRAALRWASESA